MNEIRRLPKNVSDKIAAGEVVERPVSVVKELIENAIDAGASAISVSILGGGIDEMMIADNGKGIGAEDVSLAFEKHATSKIFSENDLELISTQGFRGEALASIAAVSMVEMKTKRKEDEMGTIIKINGSHIDRIDPAGLPDGTSVIVGNLFYNVPARKKFLKKAPQEAAYISDLLSRYILAFPEISFHYTSQDKTIYHSPGNGDLEAALYSVYGNAVMDQLVFVSHESNEIKVFGYTSRPGTVLKNRRAGSVFVNRRYVRNSALHDMVKNAYGETLVKGDTPLFALNIVLPLSAVDVNVHPNKLQVRFKDATAVEYVIKEAVSASCRNIRGQIAPPFPRPESQPTSRVEMSAPDSVIQTQLFSGFTRPVLKETQMPVTFVPDVPISGTEPLQDGLPECDKSPEKSEHLPAASYRLIGSFGNTYVLLEQGDNLLVIDQHAAHERLLYEKYKNSPADTSQPLLIPYVMTVSHEQKNQIDEHLDLFQSAGFDIEPFGALEYKISAVPSIAYSTNIEEMMNDMLNEMGKSNGNLVLKRESLIMAACRSAVKAGDPLRESELRALVDSFLATNVIPTCPHGRPVISVISRQQLDKSFKRI